MYDDNFVVYVKTINSFADNSMLNEKREICLALLGQPLNTMNSKIRFTIGNKSVYKPQYIYSALTIYSSLKYPNIIPRNPVVYQIYRAKLEEEAINIASHVLQADRTLKLLI